MKRLDISELIFKILAYVLVIVFAFACLFPLIYTVAMMFSNLEGYTSGNVLFYPIGFQTDAFMSVIKDKGFWIAYTNTMYLTFYGTMFSMLISIFAAYALSKKGLFLGKFLNLFIVFTMWFSAGVIPTYQNYQRFHINSKLGFVIGFGAQAFNIILLRNYFNGISHEIEEAAIIDGASETQVLTSIYLPMSKAALATVTLFYALNRWNGYFWASQLLNTDEQPLQVYIQLLSNQEYDNIDQIFHPQSQVYAMVFLSIIPIIIMYPYIQKYFAKGVNVGGVKE